MTGAKSSPKTARFRTTEERCISLLVTLVLVLGAHPFFAHGIVGRFISGVLLIGILVTGSRAIAEGSSHRMRNYILAGLALTGVIAFLFVGLSGNPWTPIVLACFTLDVVVTLTSFVMDRQGPRRSRLIAALCVYLLLGQAFAMIYATLYAVDPGVLDFGSLGAEQSTLSVFVYYSYVTLTTLGYGDIQPISASARSISVLEAVTGVLYVAVMIASLIGGSNDDSE